MRESYEKNEKKLFTRDSIIGLGEESFRKNYYPELQEKIMDLEQINGRNKALISSSALLPATRHAYNETRKKIIPTIIITFIIALSSQEKKD